ncbi:efflux RND transporter periplasmic adaptor subunit [Portibacter lacus]|uniref:RND transporter n=1 Tax=Portibacter lacus TaxID=1099794 RepID=A0AA37WEB4_9BACT|nr:HlyD family efflux transporter periplasmic adaptor subunit [Portibacter lacus]GLR17833.1 RND transporter [Portibacter lacus]
MDREIASKERGRSQIWNILKYVIIIAILGAAFYFGRNALRRTGTMNDFFISVVEKGDIQNTLTATGIVKPSYEREINAPVNTEIKNVILPKGTVVKSGQLIMNLDQEFTKLEYERLKDELELKENNIGKLNLQYDKDLKDLDYTDQIKALTLSQLRAQVKDQERLVEIGGATDEELEQAKLKLEVAEIEKLMLENNLDYTRNANVKEKRNLELEFTIQQKRLQELKRKLNETEVRAPLDGVITWILEDVGRTVSQGEPLVRIADLNSYVIEASTSDRNTEKINVGMPVNVRINRSTLTGTISSVLPAVENNTVKFIVELDDNSDEILRPNMRAEVFLITDQKSNTLRVKNGAAFNGATSLDVFVIDGDRAVKTRITKGLSNSDYVEITSPNIREGQRVIISETEDYDHLNEFKINKK